MKKVIAYLFFLVVLGVFCLYAVIAIRPPEGGATRLTVQWRTYPNAMPTAPQSSLATSTMKFSWMVSRWQRSAKC